MTSGVLMVSRFVNLLPDWKKEVEKLGFKNIHTTSQEKDSLNSIIYQYKPRIVLVGSGFYRGSTPYMMGELLKLFPKLNIAAINRHEFPDELAMGFIINGVKSYVDMVLGMDEFKRGLTSVMDGKIYISPNVKERINMRQERPKPAGTITDRQKEVILLTCNGFTEIEIADTLNISRRTVDTLKRTIYTALNVRGCNELIRAALNLGFVEQNGMWFYPKDFVMKPLPDFLIAKRRREKKKNIEKREKI
jgi:DNA-binding NarL/FixJ family response regulator